MARGFPFEQKARGLIRNEIMELLTEGLGLKAVRIPLPHMQDENYWG